MHDQRSPLDVSIGRVPGQFPVNKYGRSNNVDAAVTDIWDGANGTNDQKIWIAPTAARVHNIASSSASDTATAGVGARTVQVWGLQSWDTHEVTEIIELDGTDDVATANAYVIIHRMRVITKGATSINVGQIEATAVSDGTITAMMLAGTGNTQMAIYGVPSDCTLAINDFYASMLRSSPATARFDYSLLYNPEPAAELLNFQVRHTDALDSAGTTSKSSPFEPPKSFIGPGILKMQGISSVSDLDVSAGFNGTLVVT
jgi:hypothetical protein